MFTGKCSIDEKKLQTYRLLRADRNTVEHIGPIGPPNIHELHNCIAYATSPWMSCACRLPTAIIGACQYICLHL